ncbi:MAG: hypothetical protein AAB875_02795 [Patescibacteria group bacterium]
MERSRGQPELGSLVKAYYIEEVAGRPKISELTREIPYFKGKFILRIPNPGGALYLIITRKSTEKELRVKEQAGIAEDAFLLDKLFLDQVNKHAGEGYKVVSPDELEKKLRR